MKKIQIKKTTEKLLINGSLTDVEISTLELIKTAVNYNPPGSGGFSVQEMSSRFRILDAVEEFEKNENPESSDTLLLEDADYENLKMYVTNTRWGVISKTIIDFVENLK